MEWAYEFHGFSRVIYEKLPWVDAQEEYSVFVF